jgi:hypothetical protein
MGCEREREIKGRGKEINNEWCPQQNAASNRVPTDKLVNIHSF